MTQPDAAPEIIDLAAELGLQTDKPVDNIIAHCRNRIDGWVAEAGGVSGIEALESLVTRQLQLVFEEVRSDEDFDRLTQVYAAEKGVRVRRHALKFDDTSNLTYGALVECRHAGADSHDRFVAVIDCRGIKLARRFFTRWHEIAHRLTTHADILEPVYRSEHDPIERLMDEIAGQSAFTNLCSSPHTSRPARGSHISRLGRSRRSSPMRSLPPVSRQRCSHALARRPNAGCLP